MLEEFDPLVGARDRVAVVAGRGREVVERVDAAHRAERRHHVLGHLALVEAGPPLRGDAAQDLRLAGSAEDLPRARRLAVEQEIPARRALERVDREAPVEGHARRDGNALLRVADRGRQRVGQADPPPVLRQAAEGVDGAGDRHGLGAADGNGGQTAAAHLCRGQRGGRPARAVERDDPVLARRLEQNEAVAPDAGHLRLADAEQDGRADGGVHGVPAVLEKPDRRRGGERMRRGAHPVGGENRRTAGRLEVTHGRVPRSIGRTLFRAPGEAKGIGEGCRPTRRIGGREGSAPTPPRWVGAVVRRRRRKPSSYRNTMLSDSGRRVSQLRRFLVSCGIP